MLNIVMHTVAPLALHFLIIILLLLLGMHR